LNSKIGSKPLSTVDFTSRFVKRWEKNFEQIKNINLNVKLTIERDFEPIFRFKTLST
jgi:hypothetical protein